MARKKSAKKTHKKSSTKASRKAVQKRVSKPAKKAPRKGKKVDPIPKGVHTVTPSLTFQDSAFALAFYEKAFGAKELFRLTEPGGKVGHAEMRIGDSLIMMADEYPEMALLSAKTLNGTPMRLSLAVKNPDALMERAVAAGATVMRPMQQEFYGWRAGVVTDPFGYSWTITCQVEELSPKQLQDRWAKMLAASKTEGSAA
ncbi:MAG: VOC family protein [Rhodospirillaceae bacterium]|nr:VOC family protein [Rhodospirillaceae bacterium]